METSMTSEEINSITNSIFESSDLDQLRQLNNTLVGRIKSLRAYKAQTLRHTLAVDDAVKWSGKYGYAEGVVTRVKRKNALVKNTSTGQVWNIPMGMLEVISK
tara:strand:- start:1865 stop:2173 length:309 start_codon:yes stop_codon:yes gene_type:complete